MQRDFFEVMIYSYSAVAWILGLIYSLGAAIVVYAIVRWRDSKNDRKDPQLGVKVGLHFLMSVSIILAVTGGSLIVVDQLVRVTGDESSSSYDAFDPYDIGPRRTRSSESKILTPATRAGFAIMLAGVMLAAGEWWLIFSRTNDLKWPVVRRMFTGARTLLHGLVVTVALTGALVVAFMDFEDGAGSAQRQMISAFLGLLCIWGFSLAVHMSLLFLYTKQPSIPGQNYHCFDCGEDLRSHSTTQLHYCPVCKATLPMQVRRSLSSLTARQQPVMATRMTASTAPPQSSAPPRPSAPPSSDPPKDPPAAQ